MESYNARFLALRRATSQPRSRPKARRKAAEQPPPKLAALLRGARYLTPDQLAERVLCLRRLAVSRHLTAHEWRAVDRMRQRLAFYSLTTTEPQS
jgi:hypothetical protein